MTHAEIAKAIKDQKENIVLLYAFNATGKTRLCVEFKNATKTAEGDHTGIYYNAYSEDLFRWHNDEENDNKDIRLELVPSSLSRFHSYITEADVEEKLAPYLPSYRFLFDQHENAEVGIASIKFFKEGDEEKQIKISRGEERIFVWCFFLALFEVEDWSKSQNDHIYIDDPVSSLDDHNIFLTVESIFALIEANYLNKRVIISTHHVGLFSILYDRLLKGEKSDRYKKLTSAAILTDRSGDLHLVNTKQDVFLYHLQLLQILEAAQKEKLLRYHIVLLRQVLENIASFLGSGKVSIVLDRIKIPNVGEVMNMINSLSHQSPYQYRMKEIPSAEVTMFNEVFNKLMATYQFELH